MSESSFMENLLDGVEVTWKSLEEVGTIKTGEAVNRQMISENPGNYPVINSGREPLGYFDVWNTDNDPIGITSRGAGVGSITWQSGKYFRGNLNYSVSAKSNAGIETKFLYHLLLEMQSDIQELCTFDGIPALNAGNLKKLQVPVPSLQVQKEIVRILDTFTELTSELTSELTNRKKQYNHYRNQLLSFREGDVEWRTLEEVVQFRRGTAITQKQTQNGDIPVIANGPEPTYYHNESNRQGETIVIARSGAYAGYVSFWIHPIFLTDAFSLHPDLEILAPRFVYHLLQNKQAQIHEMKKGAGVPHVRVSEFESYLIPIPPLAEQARIVAILDKFDTITQSISEGLPREIELRQKQYAHYRDLLLSFPNPKVVA